MADPAREPTWRESLWWRRRLVWTFHSFAFAWTPALALLVAAMRQLPFGLTDAARAIVWISIANLALLALLSLWRGSKSAAAMLTTFYVGLAFYPTAASLAAPAGGVVRAWVWATTYLLLCAVVAVRLARRPSGRDERHRVLNVAGATLIAFFAAAIGWESAFSARQWDDAVSALVASAPAPARVLAPLPDIYLVVLDGLGRPDVLRSRYGLDVNEELDRLRGDGWSIAESGRSNYSQTFLSLASAMNGVYLDPLAAEMGGGRDRRAAHHLIQRSGIIAALRRAGYEFRMIGSNYSATSSHVQADNCECSWPGLNEFENAILAMTPLRVVPLYGSTYEAHYHTVLGALDALDRSVAARPPKFVFAHIMSPHPPFVLNEHGEPVIIRGPLLFPDGDDYPGSASDYRRGYRAQTRFIMQRLVAFSNVVNAAGRPSVMIAFGDHGPGMRYSQRSLEQTDVSERFPIFMALRLGGSADEIPHDLSPVNVFRVVFNARFGSEHALLPNRSYYSTWREPYRLQEVTVR